MYCKQKLPAKKTVSIVSADPISLPEMNSQGYIVALQGKSKSVQEQEKMHVRHLGLSESRR